MRNNDSIVRESVDALSGGDGLEVAHAPNAVAPLAKGPPNNEMMVSGCWRRRSRAGAAMRGHDFVQNLHRGHYELGVHALNERLRVAAAFDELTRAI